MAHGNAVYIAREVQGEVGHVQDTVGAEAYLLKKRSLGLTENLFDQLPRKSVVTCLNGGMRRKQASASHDLKVRLHRNRVFAKRELFLQQRQRQKCRMPLVHVVAVGIFHANAAEQGNAADSQHDLLANPVVLIATVERVGESAVPVRVLRQIRIQQIHRNNES